MGPHEMADAYLRQADAFAAIRRYEDALALCDRAIEVCPESAEAWTRKATVLRLRGRLLEALECAGKALEIGPSPIAEALRDGLTDDLRRKGIL